MATDMDKELERTTEMRGFRYGLHDFEALLWGSDYLKKHNDHTQANYLKKGLLDRKAKEMAIIVACMAQKDLVSHLQCHMHAAVKAGATPEEILELIELVGGWTGNVTKIIAFEAWHATFRPDLPTINRAEQLR